jgi:CheY-like chemotaxis protein
MRAPTMRVTLLLHSQQGKPSRMRPTTILCVEDNKLVLGAVRETLELEGWRVEVCEDGTSALAKINSSEHYDLITLDNDLPGISGIELLQYARTLDHRRETPIIMFSSDGVEMEAQQAGANAFLRKPDDMSALAETIEYLLARKPNTLAKDTHE